MIRRLLLLWIVLTSGSISQTVDGGFSTFTNGSIYEVTLFTNMQSGIGTAGVLTLEFTFNDTALSFASNPVDGIDYQLFGEFSNYTTKNITRPLPNRVRVSLLTTSTSTPPLVQLSTIPVNIIKINLSIIENSLTSNLIWKTTSIAPLFLQNPYSIGFWQNSNSVLPVENVDYFIPERTELFQNYPNPFNSITDIKFKLAKGSQVKIMIFNIIGVEVFELLNEFKDAGSYKIKFNAANLPSGTYIYRLQSNGFSDSKKLTLIK